MFWGEESRDCKIAYHCIRRNGISHNTPLQSHNIAQLEKLYVYCTRKERASLTLNMNWSSPQIEISNLLRLIPKVGRGLERITPRGTLSMVALASESRVKAVADSLVCTKERERCLVADRSFRYSFPASPKAACDDIGHVLDIRQP